LLVFLVFGFEFWGVLVSLDTRLCLDRELVRKRAQQAEERGSAARGRRRTHRKRVGVDVDVERELEVEHGGAADEARDLVEALAVRVALEDLELVLEEDGVGGHGACAGGARVSVPSPPSLLFFFFLAAPARALSRERSRTSRYLG
jgi:hypothetical protein